MNLSKSSPHLVDISSTQIVEAIICDELGREAAAGTMPATAIKPVLSFQSNPRYAVAPDKLSPMAP